MSSLFKEGQYAYVLLKKKKKSYRVLNFFFYCSKIYIIENLP